jgi:hypothetical protein
VNGGVAPMSLLEYQDSVPWAESMRLELISGHMPPWRVESAPARFANVRALTARELNVLLTWAAGGTPRGTAAGGAAAAGAAGWRLGPPDLVLEPDAGVTMGADVQEHVETYTLKLPAAAARWIRAVDVMPGVPAITRAATVSVEGPSSGKAEGTAPAAEHMLAMWLPGDTSVPVREGAGFLLPAGVPLTLRVHYQKTWRNERDVLHDRSRVGLYFARGATADVRAIALAPSDAERAAAGRGATLTFTRRLDEPVEALAIYPDPLLHDADVTVRATRPDGSRETLIAFRPRSNWARRYWFREPVALPRNTQVRVSVTFTPSSSLLPPGMIPPAPMDPSRVRLTLNVVRPR